MLFHKKHQTIIIACIFLVISLIILSYSVKQVSGTGFFRKLVLEMATPFIKLVNIPINEVNTAWKRYLFLVGLEEENRRLKKENTVLANKLLQYREGYLEGLRLQKILNLSEKRQYPFVTARVIAKSQTSLIKTILIDKGISDNIKSGLPVVTEGGAVGRIIESSWHSSKILLLIDETSNVDATLQEGRSQGILRGDGSGICLLKYIPKSEKVKVGDCVISSGITGLFPKGELLGLVTATDTTQHGLFQKVQVVPYVDFSKLEEVLVILTDKNGGQ